MDKRIIMGVGLGLAVAVPLCALVTTVRAAAKDVIQVQTALDSSAVSSQESNLGNLIADAIRQTGGADIALVPADEILETQIPAGSIAPGRILKAIRYNDDPSDSVVVVNLTGAQLAKALERSVSRAPQPFEGFLQVSGVQVRYSPSDVAGKRVTLDDVQPTQTYHVAMTHTLANGGLGYFQIWSKKDIIQDTGQTVSQSLASYLAAHRSINSVVAGRITTR